MYIACVSLRVTSRHTPLVTRAQSQFRVTLQFNPACGLARVLKVTISSSSPLLRYTSPYIVQQQHSFAFISPSLYHFACDLASCAKGHHLRFFSSSTFHFACDLACVLKVTIPLFRSASRVHRHAFLVTHPIQQNSFVLHHPHLLYPACDLAL